MISLALVLAVTAPTDSDQRLSRMTALYEQICLKTFPDDRAVDALMTAMRATPLTPEQVKITLRDDPGRGWFIKDGTIDAALIFEDPPYHACSLRWPMPENVGDLRDYRAAAEKYKIANRGFTTIDPYDVNIDDIHVHAVGEQRDLPDGRVESLFIIDQHVTDPKRRAAGETGTMLRFVHQIASPGAK